MVVKSHNLIFLLLVYLVILFQEQFLAQVVDEEELVVLRHIVEIPMQQIIDLQGEQIIQNVFMQRMKKLLR